MFDLRPDTYIVGFWAFSLPAWPIFAPAGGDVTGVLFRQKDATCFRFQYRHRIYNPKEADKVIWQGSSDRFLWSHIDVPEDAPEEAARILTNVGMSAVAGLVAKTFSLSAPPKVDYFDVRGDRMKIIELCKQGKNPSWFHFKVTTPEEQATLPPKYIRQQPHE